MEKLIAQEEADDDKEPVTDLVDPAKLPSPEKIK